MHAHLKAEKVSHDCSCAAAQLVAELGKVIQVGLVQGVTHDLNVHLVKVLCNQQGVLDQRLHCLAKLQSFHRCTHSNQLRYHQLHTGE